MDDSALREFAGFAAVRSGALIRVAFLLTGDQHAAEDLLQTALTKTAARWGRIHTAPEAYVRQVMYREQVSGWRRRARHRDTAMAEVLDLSAAVPDISAETGLGCGRHSDGERAKSRLIARQSQFAVWPPVPRRTGRSAQRGRPDLPKVVCLRRCIMTLAYAYS